MIPLQEGLVQRLEAAGAYRREKRPFWPHVTALRVRPERGGRRRPRHVDKPPERLPEPLLEPFEAVRLALYRSYLRPQGAEYVRIAHIQLPTAGGGPKGET